MLLHRPTHRMPGAMRLFGIVVACGLGPAAIGQSFGILNPTRVAELGVSPGGDAIGLRELWENQSFSRSLSGEWFHVQGGFATVGSVSVWCGTTNTEASTGYSSAIVTTETTCQGLQYNPRAQSFVTDLVEFDVDTPSIYQMSLSRSFLFEPDGYGQPWAEVQIRRPYGSTGRLWGGFQGPVSPHAIPESGAYGYQLDEQQGECTPFCWYRSMIDPGHYRYKGQHSGDLNRPNCPPGFDSMIVGGSTSFRLLAPCSTTVEWPLNGSICPGANAELRFRVRGDPNLRFQWYKRIRPDYLFAAQDIPLSDGPTGHGSTINGSRTDRLVITGFQEEDANEYWCEATTSYGMCTRVHSKLNSSGQPDEHGDGVLLDLSESCCEHPVNPRGTFLRTDQADSAEPPTIIPLSDCGVLCGNTVRLEQLGAYVSCAGDSRATMIGVFSTSNVVLGYDQPNRIPGAIRVPELDGVVTPPTQLGVLPTDIVQDFVIRPEDTLTIPCNAQYLMLSPLDNCFADNAAPPPPAVGFMHRIYICRRPRIVEQPIDTGACLGDDIALSITSRNWRPFDIQWRKNGVNIYNQPGHIANATQNGVEGTAAPFTILGLTADDAGEYDCVVTNRCGNRTSEVANVSVIGTPPAIVQQTSRPFPFLAGIADFEIVAFGAETYHWRKDGVPINPNNTDYRGVNTRKLTINPVLYSYQGLYDCVVSNGCGSVVSNAEPLRLRGETLPGDLDNNCQVDLADLVLLLASFGSSNSGDLDADGDTDLTDLTLLLGHFGESCS